MIDPVEAHEGREKVMLSLAFLIAFLLHLLLFATAPMVNEIMWEMDLSHADFGLIFSASMISLVVLRIPWGIATDKHGYQSVLRISLLLISSSAILRSFSANYLLLLSSQLLLGVGLASVLPCLPVLVREWSRSRTGFATGIYVSGFASGSMTALGLTPYLLQIMEWREVLFAYGIFAFLVAVFWWGLAESGMESKSRYELNDFAGMFGDKYVWVLVFFMVACMGGYDTLQTWMPKVLELKSLEKSIALLLPAGFLLSGPIIGRLSDKIRKEATLITLLGVASAVSVTGLALADGPLLMFLAFFAGFFTMGILTLTLRAPARHPRFASSAGKVSGLISSLGNIGPAMMPVVFGFFIDLTGTYEVSIFFVALILISTFLIGSREWE